MARMASTHQYSTSLDKNIGDEGDNSCRSHGDDAPSPEDHALETDRKEMIRGLLDRWTLGPS